MSSILDRRENGIRTRHRPSALNAPFIPDLEKAVAGGVATLDEVFALVPDAQLATGAAAAGKALLGDRTWGDVATQVELNAEAGTRAADDATLQANITAEAGARAAAVTAEATARATADGLLQPLSGLDANNGYPKNRTGAFVPTWTGLTVVNGTGAATYTGRYTRIGDIVHVEIYIATSGTCTTAATAATTTVDNLPFTIDGSFPAVFGVVDSNIADLGNGCFLSGTKGYMPTWSARATDIIVSGWYRTTDA